MFNLREDLILYSSESFQRMQNDILSLEFDGSYYRVKYEISNIFWYFFGKKLKLKINSEIFLAHILKMMSGSNSVKIRLIDKAGQVLDILGTDSYRYSYDSMYKSLCRDFLDNNEDIIFTIEFSLSLKKRRRLTDNFLRLKKVSPRSWLKYMRNGIVLEFLICKDKMDEIIEFESPKNKFNDLFFKSNSTTFNYLNGTSRANLYYSNKKFAILNEYLLLGSDKSEFISSPEKYSYNIPNRGNDYGLRTVEDAYYLFDILDEIGDIYNEYAITMKYPSSIVYIFKKYGGYDFYNDYMFNKYHKKILNKIMDLDFLLYSSSSYVIEREIPAKLFIEKILKKSFSKK